jgi:hypothetical protein
MNDQPSEKKIHVDEDWKSRVEAERAAAQVKSKAAESHPAEEKPPAREEQPAAHDPDPVMPPADLMYIASTIYMQALVALGVVADPITRTARMRPNLARHAIDTLDVLRQKTEGNRTAEETEAMDAMLHEVRMAYVAKAGTGS